MLPLIEEFIKEHKTTRPVVVTLIMEKYFDLSVRKMKNLTALIV